MARRLSSDETRAGIESPMIIYDSATYYSLKKTLRPIRKYRNKPFIPTTDE